MWWLWREDGSLMMMVWWRLFMEVTAVRRQWGLILISPSTQFATYDSPMMDLNGTWWNWTFLFYLYFLAMPTSWHFSHVSCCSRMFSEDTPHFFSILGYRAFCHHKFMMVSIIWLDFGKSPLWAPLKQLEFLSLLQYCWHHKYIFYLFLH